MYKNYLLYSELNSSESNTEVNHRRAATSSKSESEATLSLQGIRYDPQIRPQGRMNDLFVYSC